MFVYLEVQSFFLFSSMGKSFFPLFSSEEKVAIKEVQMFASMVSLLAVVATYIVATFYQSVVQKLWNRSVLVA